MKEFEIIAEIDYWYFVISQMSESLNLKKSRSPLEHMIDQATGYDKKLAEDAKAEVKTAIDIFKKIIRLKKKIEADVESDEKLLHQLFELRKS